LAKKAAHNAAPGLEIFGFAEMRHVVFQRLPVNLQHVLIGVFDDVVQLEAMKATCALKQGQGLLHAGFKISLCAGFDGDVRHFADHIGFL
jgi:hypothetical protein